MIPQTLGLRHLDPGPFIVASYHIPLSTACALALDVGGPRMPAGLVVVSTLLQGVLALRAASLRRIFLPDSDVNRQRSPKATEGQ